MLLSTALRLTGRDVLPLLHRTTSNALADLVPGAARATLFCDYRGRLLHRAVVAVAADGSVWLLRHDAPGDELAAAVGRMVFREDVRLEDRSSEFTVALVLAQPADAQGLTEAGGLPRTASSGDGTLLALDGREALTEAGRIRRLLPRHGHEITEAFNPFEVGLAHEVHLAKGCFTGQEALQRLVTYESVRRRPALVRLGAGPVDVPAEILLENGERAGVLTSVAGNEGFAVLRHEPLADHAALLLAGGGRLEVIAAPEPARPIGRP